ncbi:hypothetical protein [Bordetella bronchiseptica]|uniref:hypothetical protein n=1 Tax=Bordetella bronchiseptica TaxID=518 RepID=UPI000461B65C|nr:hypothetical protein [Bordetella bronchiseptica]KDD42533.1 hypothetical protein L529_0526 [Bordetella bronchiseptica MBORD901]
MTLLQKITEGAIGPALALLPTAMDTAEARVMLLAICLQESAGVHRFQVVRGRPGVRGPARGLWQFEKGTRASRGGVWGVYLHHASRKPLEALCAARSVRFDPDAIYGALEYDDALAAGVARLLLWTDPQALPAVGDVEAAWALYLRTWRPGAYTRGTEAQRAALRKKWTGNYAQALAEVAQ